jgi:ribosomal protein S18 acetylase RimI-like enzyme
MKEIFTRKATKEDIATLRKFEQGVIGAERSFTTLFKPDPIHYYDLQAMISDPEIHFLIAELDGFPVACGYARFEKTKHFYAAETQAYLGMMYVVPEHRGKGINSLIMNALKEIVKQRGVRELCLEVYASNFSAIKAYEKAGFKNYIRQMRMSLPED